MKNFLLLSLVVLFSLSACKDDESDNYCENEPCTCICEYEDRGITNLDIFSGSKEEAIATCENLLNETYQGSVPTNCYFDE